jgi:hypothetical protein
MKLEQLESISQGKNFTIAEALHYAFKCGMDKTISAAIGVDDHVSEATMLSYIGPRVCRPPNARVDRAGATESANRNNPSSPAPVERLDGPVLGAKS